MVKHLYLTLTGTATSAQSAPGSNDRERYSTFPKAPRL